jgi:DNA polymerase I-like protein with 3'-5' exonuclease and polymerase domains
LDFSILAVDTEGYAPKHLGTSVATPTLHSMYFPLNHKEDVNIDEEVKSFLDHVLAAVPYRIFHHAGHDITILPDLWDKPFICTMIMAHMVDENVMSKGLDYLHKVYCGGEGKQRDPSMQYVIDTLGWEYVPFELMNLYASNDAKITMELYLTLLPLYEAQFGPMWKTEST